MATIAAPDEKATRDYDPIIAEVIQNRLRNISLEMATTLIRTSGSPILSEAKDFCCAVFDRKIEHIGFSGYVIAHMGSSLEGVRAVARQYAGDIHPGDAFILNDPYDGGAIHQGDVAIVAPLFWREQLVGWAFSNAHILDIGGMSPGGWAPVAWDCYGEALRLPPIRIVNRGQFIPDMVRLLVHNVRLPIVINDVRSLVAALNVAQMRVADLLDIYGLDEYERYIEVNKDLCEQVVRGRIAALPDGVYEAYDWAEYDGHGDDRLYKIGLRLVVDGSDLLLDFTDTDAQSDGFINAGYGAMLGVVGSILLFALCYDMPANAGLFRPVRMQLPPPGTVLHPVLPAPVSCGHMEGASKAARAAAESFAKALGIATDPELRKRTFSLGVMSWPGNSWVGLSQFGSYTAFAVMDCGSGGMGAQTTIDGLDISSYEVQLGNGIPDVEINEGNYPMLYLWRRLNKGSGGPGFNRGGQGMDFAWTPWRTDALIGTLENAMSSVPTRAMLGGYPGGTNFFNVVRGSAITERLANGKSLPHSVAELHSTETTLPNHTAGVPLNKGDVFHQITGGGAGLGEPLFRDPERVLADVIAGYVTVDAAKAAYGVVVDPERMAVDEQATAHARREIRRQRLHGNEPASNVSAITEWRPALKLAGSGGEQIECGYCGVELARAGADWKVACSVSVAEASGRLAALGVRIRPRQEPAIDLYEWSCPRCASLLETNLYPRGMAPIHDLRLGEKVSEPIGSPL